jgi:methyltransferase (TIGR00027 family)
MNQSKENIETKGAAKTGIVPTFLVAIEQYFQSDERIIHDNFAFKILPVAYQLFIKLMRFSALRNWIIKASEKQVPGIWSGFMCRKRYIDDKVVLAVTDKLSVDAVVNLGAGYDTRLYRLPALENVSAWEVDQSENIKSKQANLEKILGSIPKNITLVPINFIEQELGTVLKEYGYFSNTKTFFIWEAVSQYLTETSVRQTFNFLSQVSAGSRLAFTYVRKDFIEGKKLYGLEKFYDKIIVKDKVWHFGFEPNELDSFLGEYGWRMVEHLGYG